jgi:hypothetical protein
MVLSTAMPMLMAAIMQVPRFSGTWARPITANTMAMGVRLATMAAMAARQERNTPATVAARMATMLLSEATWPLAMLSTEAAASTAWPVTVNDCAPLSIVAA